MLKVCITGHRPAGLGGYDEDNPIIVWVREKLAQVLDHIRPNYAYSGMALGADQEFAQICIDMGIPFTAVMPFKGQDTKWPEAAQFRYWAMMRQARTFVTVCEPGYAAWKLQRRNQWLVDEIGTNGIVIAVYGGGQGGTANCLAYARQCNRQIILLDPVEQLVSPPPALRVDWPAAI